MSVVRLMQWLTSDENVLTRAESQVGAHLLAVLEELLKFLEKLGQELLDDFVALQTLSFD